MILMFLIKSGLCSFLGGFEEFADELGQKKQQNVFLKK